MTQLIVQEYFSQLKQQAPYLVMISVCLLSTILFQTQTDSSVLEKERVTSGCKTTINTHFSLTIMTSLITHKLMEELSSSVRMDSSQLSTIRLLTQRMDLWLYG
jgi:hypothetical protein